MKNSLSIYRMPAEWEPHAAIWLAWPHDEISFPRLAKVEDAIVSMIAAVAGSERVELLVLDALMEDHARAKLLEAGVDLGQINFRQINYMNAWMRDCAPLFVYDKRQQLVMTQWVFNAWGEKFPDLLIDKSIPSQMEKWLQLPMLSPDFVLEGGAIDVNGQGICLTTEQCLLNPNRNPLKSRKANEDYLKKYLGIKQVIWLGEGLYNDHTDGHIDEIARFVDVNTIVYADEDNPEDENYAALKANYQILLNARNLQGQPFELIKLPMPHCTYDQATSLAPGEKIPASYTNFYIGNTVVLAPIFNDPNDQLALSILKRLFPGRKVIAIDCSDIIYGGGAVHCLTQQQPVKK